MARREGAKLSEKALKEVNKARKYVGLPLLVRKEKRCLKCNKKFFSQDAINQRLCDHCRLMNKRL